MANFPDSIYSPASKSAGQTITAAFFNDPDGEITAIETGYINGTARLNSSNLNVTGTSTFANRPITPPPNIARLQIVDPFALAAGTTAAMSWTNQAIITNSSMHSTVTNPTQITPQSTGVYWCHAQIGFNYSSAGILEINTEDSSGGIVAYALNRSTANSGPTFSAAGPKRFDVTGGYIRVVVKGAGSTNSVSTDVTHFTMYKL